MAEPISLGFEGLSIPSGTHICALFRGVAERDQIMVPFLLEGLRATDKCACIIDEGVDEVRVALGGDAGRVDIRSSNETYLRRGSFSTEAMLDFWDDFVGGALDTGDCPFVRSAGETTWTLRELPGLDDFLVYESELNRFLPRYPQVIMCLYDLDRFRGQVLVDILKTHPKVLIGGTVLENLHYVEPDEFLASR